MDGGISDLNSAWSNLLAIPMIMLVIAWAVIIATAAAAAVLPTLLTIWVLTRAALQRHPPTRKRNRAEPNDQRASRIRIPRLPKPSAPNPTLTIILGAAVILSQFGELNISTTPPEPARQEHGNRPAPSNAESPRIVPSPNPTAPAPTTSPTPATRTNLSNGTVKSKSVLAGEQDKHSGRYVAESAKPATGEETCTPSLENKANSPTNGNKAQPCRDESTETRTTGVKAAGNSLGIIEGTPAYRAGKTRQTLSETTLDLDLPICTGWDEKPPRKIQSRRNLQ